MLIELKAQLLRIEEKVRHVRTQEGVRKYGLPIGSPIVARARTLSGKKVKAKKVAGKPTVYAETIAGRPGMWTKPNEFGVQWRTDYQRGSQRGIYAIAVNGEDRITVEKGYDGDYRVNMKPGDGARPYLSGALRTMAEVREWVDDQYREHGLRSGSKKRTPKAPPASGTNTPDGKPVGRRTKMGIQWRNPVPFEADSKQVLVGNLEDGRKFQVQRTEAGDYIVFVRSKDGNFDGSKTGLPSLNEAKKWAEQYLADEKARTPVRKPRQHENFFDNWEGVYGYDWTWGTEDPQTLEDALSEDKAVSQRARRQLAYDESVELGITVSGNGTTNIDVAAHEHINALMRAYEKMYPGFAAYVPNFYIDGDGASKTGSNGGLVNAYNMLTKAVLNLGYEKPYVTPKTDHMGYERDWDYTEIGLGPHLFGQDFNENFIADMAIRNKQIKWSAVDIEQTAKTTGMEKWQVAMLRTLNHELGHTFARVGLGEMDSQTTSSRNNTQDFRVYLYWALVGKGAIAEIPDEKYDPNDPDGSIARYMTVNTQSLNVPVITEHISQYGASNLHELMAESWASYMMDDNPSELAVEIAELMDMYFMKWMASEYPGEEKYVGA